MTPAQQAPASTADDSVGGSDVLVIGAGFSIAPIFFQSAWFRYHNRDPHIPDLYFAAAGAHPGAGMPGMLCSAKVVERLIEEEEQAGVRHLARSA